MKKYFTKRLPTWLFLFALTTFRVFDVVIDLSIFKIPTVLYPYIHWRYSEGYFIFTMGILGLIVLWLVYGIVKKVISPLTMIGLVIFHMLLVVYQVWNIMEIISWLAAGDFPS